MASNKTANLANIGLDKVIGITPIYREIPDQYELISLQLIKNNLDRVHHQFVHPTDLNISFYKINFPQSSFLMLPNEYFQSRESYNQLCYERRFYELFSATYEFLFIIQTDALMIQKDDFILPWINSGYDYIGSPEAAKYQYDLKSIGSFSILDTALHPIVIQGLNGGFCLRRLSKFIELLDFHSDLANAFRNYGPGIGEDIFFSVLARITQKKFLVPNEVIASKFGLTSHYLQWINFNNGALPIGLHAWQKRKSDLDCTTHILRQMKLLPSERAESPI